MVCLGQSYSVEYTQKPELYAGACTCRAVAICLEALAAPSKHEKASVVGPYQLLGDVMGSEERKQIQPHTGRSGVRRAEDSFCFPTSFPSSYLEKSNTGLLKRGRRGLSWLSAKRIERHTSSAHPPPNVRLKLLRKMGVHKASPNSSSLWQKLHHSKK